MIVSDETESQVVAHAPPPLPKLDPSTYRERLKREVDNDEYAPVTLDGNTYTWCNVFVRTVAKWFGWNNFKDSSRDQAGEMTRYMRNHPTTFRPLTKVEARELACSGHLVIAGDDMAQGTATGHVCIIAPERKMAYSKKWKCNVPIVANVGKTRFYGRGMNWAFRRQPDVFLYLGS